jgi:hypothetical protein
MKHIHYDRGHATKLLPLLGAIGREIQERNEALELLEQEIETLSTRPAPDQEVLHGLIAQASAQRRGLRHARIELERLGCSVVGTAPLTFRIPGRVGEAKTSFVWQTGDPVLK